MATSQANKQRLDGETVFFFSFSIFHTIKFKKHKQTNRQRGGESNILMHSYALTLSRAMPLALQPQDACKSTYIL